MRFIHRAGSAAILIAFALSLGGCATGSVPTGGGVVPAADSSVEGRIGTLPPQNLQAGSCGMFLWARNSRRDLVFFTSDRTLAGRIVLDGREVNLPRTMADGDIVFGQYTEQQFGQGPVKLRLLVQPDANSGIIGGVVVRQGMLNIRVEEGWDLVLPVAGLIACKGA